MTVQVDEARCHDQTLHVEHEGARKWPRSDLCDLAPGDSHVAHAVQARLGIDDPPAPQYDVVFSHMRMLPLQVSAETPSCAS